MYDLTCKLCGKPFQSQQNTARFCKRHHTMACNYCGKKFSIDGKLAYYYDHRDTACCSRSCSTKLRYKNMSEEERDRINENRKKSFRAKYGVENPGQLKEVLDKRERTNIKKYGFRYPQQNKEFAEKTKRTNLKRYGVEYTFQAEEVKKKTQETVRKRYGANHISKTKQFHDSIKKTSREKYGTDYPVQSSVVQEKIKQSTREKYGVDYALQSKDVQKKAQKVKMEKYGSLNPKQSVERIKRTNKERYGQEWYTQTDEYKARVKETDRRKYGVDHHLSSDAVKSKRVETVFKKYGVDNVRKSEWYVNHLREVFKERYGVEWITQDPEVRKKQIAHSRSSKLEERVAYLLDSYNIVYERQFILKKDNVIHLFDFYIPEYKILLDADGVYYHSYLSDPDGKHVRDDYDDVRLYLVPQYHTFILAVEGHEEQAVKQVYKTIKQMDEGVYDCEGELFRWCRAVGFPYPVYTAERMEKDWTHLCLYENNMYKPTYRLGMSIVSHFHKSVYNGKVGKARSVKEAWEDDEALKRVIVSRLVYQNVVNPSKVLKGFNVCKEAPVVSRFNPVLAKHLVRKYLNEFDEVFDPFSGFSGRLLGVAACGKKYVGQDIRWQAVEESNQIIRFLDLKDCSVVQKDVLKSYGTYDCLLTCPPYSDKETYGDEVSYKTCDGWIDECLQRFKCSKYVFVVDETENYKDFVVEEVQNSSHFSKAVERVVVIVT